MVPVVLTELLSDPRLPSEVAETLILRAKAIAKRRKARLGDALIAQTCIDRGIPLLTRDRDFRR